MSLSPAPTMTSPPSAPTRCLFGSGLVTDGEGAPLSPGGPAMTEDLLDRADFRPGERVVDLGCGQGRSVGLMAARGLRTLGIDADPAALAVARRRVPGPLFLKARGEALPLPDGSVDGVLTECVLSILPDRLAALREWVRILRVGGRLAFSDVYARRPEETVTPPGDDGPILSANQLQHLFSMAGLTVIHFEDRSDLLRAWVGRFIFHYGSLDALWGDGGARKAPNHLALGYCTGIAVKADQKTSVSF
ncbi:MAG: methyltransferase domain-containing protein [Rhodospirillum sp.]|nr:methyltransferase domain-containing protein [Rhodospirillum sp.]MCF8489229.1 methyltransferase domain-containing protein [Rhodospirillum sp.]MCF8500534.1 methyltransferase domain-containing protein [Rhodospirillum sp.]